MILLVVPLVQCLLLTYRSRGGCQFDLTQARLTSRIIILNIQFNPTLITLIDDPAPHRLDPIHAPKTAKQAGSVKAEGVTKTKTDGKGKGKGKEPVAVNGASKGKGKAKEAVAGEKKPRAKSVKKVEKPVEPPVFEKVDTRLGHVEAEQKIMVSHRYVTLAQVADQ